MTNKFEELLRCEYASEATLRLYLSVARRFLAFKGDGSPDLELRRYLLSLEGRDARTVNLHRAAILKFYKITEGTILGGLVPMRKTSKKLPQVLSPASVIRAINGCLKDRDRLILRILYCCGLRLSELTGLRAENVLRDKHFLLLKDTKGQKHRIVPIPESLRKDLYEYVDGCVDSLFPDIHIRTVERIVARAFKEQGVHASPHMLRHSFATDQIGSGQNVVKVQAWLGHSDIKTTLVYLHLSEAQLSESTDLMCDDLL
jgi:integrase